MYEIIRVGIPIRECDVTETFLNVIKEIQVSKDCIAITTIDYTGDLNNNGDYVSSPAGHDILFKNLKFYLPENPVLKHNVINTLGFIWQIKNENNEERDPKLIISILYNLLDRQFENLKFKKVYVFTTGSPHHYDLFTYGGKEVRPLSIIDTYSSIIITKTELEKKYSKPVIVRHYENDFIKGNNKCLINNHINLFPAISNNYKPNINLPLIQHFFNSLDNLLNDNDIFLYCYVNKNGAEINKLSFKEAKTKINYFSESNLLMTYGVLLNDNSRTIRSDIS
jgi:hypothetical protein